MSLALAPYVSFAGYDMDFISLDGSVALSLSFDDAMANSESGTFTWSLPDQPWQDGDQLMLRVRTSGLISKVPTEFPGAEPPRPWTVDYLKDEVRKILDVYLNKYDLPEGMTVDDVFTVSTKACQKHEAAYDAGGIAEYVRCVLTKVGQIRAEAEPFADDFSTTKSSTLGAFR